MNNSNTRRSKSQLEKDIMNALERLVIERGFINIPMLAVVKEAGIDANIFYRHYGTIDKLYEKFVSQYNFWLNDTLHISDIRQSGDKRFYAESLKRLYTELKKNIVMQKLLLWELEEDNPTTRGTANMREKLNLNLFAYYEEVFAKSGIDILGISAPLIAGIFYLILRHERSTFCSLDLTSEQGEKRILDAIDTLVDILFEKLEEKKRQKEIIQRMLEDNIPEVKIAEYLGISAYQLKKILA